MSKHYISVTVDEDHIIKLLKNKLKEHSNRNSLAEAIFTIAKENHELETLTKALMEMTPATLKYKVGDIVMVRQKDVSTYGMDVEKTIQKGLLKADHFICEIKQVQVWSRRPYLITYDVIRETGEVYNKEYQAEENILQPLEEFPEDMV